MTWDTEAGLWYSVNVRLLAHSLCQAAVCFLLEHGNACVLEGLGAGEIPVKYPMTQKTEWCNLPPLLAPPSPRALLSLPVGTKHQAVGAGTRGGGVAQGHPHICDKPDWD